MADLTPATAARALVGLLADHRLDEARRVLDAWQHSPDLQAVAAAGQRALAAHGHLEAVGDGLGERRAVSAWLGTLWTLLQMGVDR